MRAIVWLAMLLLTAPLLGGCGFRPLYGETAEGRSVEAELRSVEIAPATDRTGQLIRNAMLEGIAPADAGGGRYRLEMTVNELEERAIISSRDDSTQQRLVINVAYRLIDGATGRVVNEGRTFADTTYTRTRLPVANQQARESAREALARVLAGDIRTRLAAWLADHG